jgi:hypothetical protein
MNDRLIKLIMTDEYFDKKKRNKKDVRPQPPVFNPRPKFFVFNRISKQSNFLQLNETSEDKPNDNEEEDQYGLVNPERIVSNELGTLRVYETKKSLVKKETLRKKPTRNISKRNSNEGLIDLESGNELYVQDSKYFEEKKYNIY